MENQPTSTQQRIALLDVYRGFAVFGIFVVNITIMNSTFLHQDEFAKQWTATIDQWAERILQLFFYTKFFPIFSLLFGLGISMQALKWLEKPQAASSFFTRRMAILFLIGALHIVLLWSGDVVHLYALLGTLTPFFLHRTNKLILALAAGILVFPFYDTLLEWCFSLVHFQPETYLSNFSGETVHRVITKGSYPEGVLLRLREYASNAPMLLGFLAPIAMAMFLLGLYLGKNRIFQSLESFITRMKKPAIFLALITNAYRVLFLFVLTNTEIYRTAMVRTLLIKLMVLSDVAMGLFYLWALGWIWHNTSWKKLLIPFTYTGRMALTNYIGQSIIGLFLFSSVGCGLYEHFSPSETLFIAILVGGFQMIFSRIWLHYFRYGPLEWIWRCLSYKSWLPLSRR